MRMPRRAAMLCGTLCCWAILDACQVDSGYPEESSQCTVYDRSKWVSSGLGGTEVTAPLCPVITGWPSFYQAMVVEVRASDTAKLVGGATGYGRVAFYDFSQRLIGYPQVQHGAFFFHGTGGGAASATYYGGYLAGADTVHASGADFARVRVYTKAPGIPWDSARGEAYLEYRRRASAQLSGPATGFTSQYASFSVDATSEFRQPTFEWFVDGVSQGAPSAAATAFTAMWTAAGSHTVAVRIVPPESSPDPTPYDLPIAIEIANGPGCGGEGQEPCTVPPRVVVKRSVKPIRHE